MQLLRWLIAASLLVCFGAIATAQTPTGAIEGTVSDPTGAVVPNAKVVISEVATGRNIPVTSDAMGRFTVRNLLPGAYNVRVEASGFRVKEIRNLNVSTGSVVNASTTLEVGSTSDVVQVSAEAILVDTTRQVVDSVVTTREIEATPLFSRNFLDLAAFAPGTFIRDGGSIDPTKEVAYRTVGIAGRSGTATRVQVDGIDVTDETVGTTVANLSQEAISEFQLTRSSLDPSTSLTSSGSINIISASGGNQIHGAWFFDYYNQDMGARLQYEPEAIPYNRKRTGGKVGGPFAKDKLFWFANWERDYEQKQSVVNVPQFPQLNVNQAFPVGIRYTDGRLDWNVSSSLRLFYRMHHDWNLANGGNAVSPFQNVNWTNTSTVGLDYNSATRTHSYRFGYVNFNNRIDTQELDFKFLRTPNGIPYYLGVGPYGAGPNGLAPQATFQDNWQNSYEGSWFAGKHTLRYGFDVRRIILGGFANFAGPLEVIGQYDQSIRDALQAAGKNVQDPTEYPFENIEMGPANGFFNLAPAHGLAHGGHFVTRTAWFLQDSIKLTRNFTMNVGVRWQYDSGYFASKDVPRDPILERWGKGYSTRSEFPKNAFSPSFGFAWDPRGNGKTVIRGGFYKGYEMNILNNTMFDEYAMLPAGIGPDIYDITHVAGPDGTPINVDGRHPDGDYSDLIGSPIKSVIGTIGQLQAGLNAAYSGYAFDPNKGESAFRTTLGNTFGGQIPGKAFKIPYALQFNLGVQRELKPGTVLSVDYIYNHAVGLPVLLAEMERRRDAATLNPAAASTKVNTVLKGQTVDQWIAANPRGTIGSFGLINDTIFQGLYPDILRARLFQGGFTKYRGLQASLRGSQRELGLLRDVAWNVGYALARGEATATAGRVEFLTNTLNNRDWNGKDTFGPNGLDFTHILTVNGLFTAPGGFRLNSVWKFRTAAPLNIGVPNLGGAISGSQGFFGTDLNGDGTTGTTPRTDLLPGVGAGQFGRRVKSFKDLNQIIQQFNSATAGQITPHGKALVQAGIFTEAQLKRLGAVVPTIPLVPESNPYPFHNQLVTDVRLDRPISLAKLREGMQLVPYLDFYNLFNHAPQGAYGGLGTAFGSLNFDYSKGGPGEQVTDLAVARGRINDGRRLMFGFRFEF